MREDRLFVVLYALIAGATVGICLGFLLEMMAVARLAQDCITRGC